MGRSEIGIILDTNPSNEPERLPSFEPGQTISGRVIFSLYAQKTVDAINIVFEGQCCTRVSTYNGGTNTQTQHKETIALFAFSQTLFQGPYTMQPTTLSLPFSFTLPESSDFTRTRTNRHIEMFNQEPQPLPPSLDISSDYDAKITYQLTAAINPSSFLGTKKSVLPIHLSPVSVEPIPAPPSYPICILDEQYYKSNSLRPEQHTFKQKMAHIFKNDPALKTPSILFGATVHMPSCASIWQYLPLAISIQHQSTGPTDPPNPTLILEQVTLQLKRHTSVLAKGESAKGKSITSIKDIVVAKQLALDNTPLEISSSNATTNDEVASVRLADMDLVEAAELPVPSFTTYTINHTYKLKLLISILHPETRHRFRFEAKTLFEISPPFIGNSNANNSMGQARKEMNRVDLVVNDERELPGYYDATSSAAPAYRSLSNGGQYGEESNSKVAKEQI